MSSYVLASSSQCVINMLLTVDLKMLLFRTIVYLMSVVTICFDAPEPVLSFVCPDGWALGCGLKRETECDRWTVFRHVLRPYTTFPSRPDILGLL